MRRTTTALSGLLTLLSLAGEARGESEFWEEMASPGITEYRELVSAGCEAIDAGDFQRALTLLEQARARMPGEGLAHAWSAYVLARVGRNDQAVRACDQAREGGAVLLDQERLAYECALGYARSGRYQDGAELLGQLLSRGVSPRLRAQVLLGLGDMLVAGSCDGLEEAIELFQEEVRDNPDDAGGHFRLAAALIRAGRAEEGGAELSSALRLDPQWQTFSQSGFVVFPSYDVHLFRALSWQQLGHEDQARQEWQTYLGSGGSDGCWADLARERLGRTARPPARSRP